MQVAASEVVIIWEAPHIDGNFPIQYYRLDFKAKGEIFLVIQAFFSSSMLDCETLHLQNVFTCMPFLHCYSVLL